MRIPTTRPARRTAFTLIELLVVIAIIAILIGLTAAGVMKFMVKGPEIQTRSELSQMSAAAALFKEKFKVDYIPSRIRLCKFSARYAASPAPAAEGGPNLDAQSQAYMKKLFNRCAAQWATGGIDWNSAWAGSTTGNEEAYLYGEECLVFFLGGRQETVGTSGGVLGFSTNPANPMDTDATKRISPFYDFPSKRLVASTKAPGFYVYADPYGTPYAFFSANKVRNQYTTYSDGTNPRPDTNLGVVPYLEAPGRYYNPESFQIISAGRDKKFGPGPTLPATGNGFDDMSNFSDKLLGALP
jgi:prepilin-type N-terminal cleavage/methylation domain-containing protein